MENIIDRLNEYSAQHQNHGGICAEASDYIKELEGKIAALHEEMESGEGIKTFADINREVNQRVAEMLESGQKPKPVKEVTWERVLDILQAEFDGRCAILSEPMRPMVCKPNESDVFCPNCGETLSGGWPMSDADDCRRMYQCPNCGQSVDTEKCVVEEE